MTNSASNTQSPRARFAQVQAPPKQPRQNAAKRAEVKQKISEALSASADDKRPSLYRKERKRAAKAARITAYDFETTRIAEGTPRPLYLTAFDPNFQIDGPIHSMAHLTQILKTRFLTIERKGCKYVAWNGNRFDAYFIAAALVRETEFKLQPYMTKNKTLRGLRVVLRQFAHNGQETTDRHSPSWEFLDGIAMLGLAGVSLKKLLDNFAPDYAKLTGNIDFEREEFDPDNPKHCTYAMRDSEGLYWAMTRAQSIMLDTFNQPLAVTMGGACIKIFTAHIPKDKVIHALPPEAMDIIRGSVMRGGYCYCVRRYDGPVWKYDINQAYAAAMREAELPAGGIVKLKISPRKVKTPFIARITASHSRNRVPFYYRENTATGSKARFSANVIYDTWITSIEYAQLLAEGWAIHDVEAWAWADSFNMREYVDKLEVLRINADGGPSGPIGTMVKATGNHSYGKTLERVEPIEYVIAAECPDDCLPFYGDGSDPIEHIYYRVDDDRKPKAHHQPHVGSFITAHVRMVLRRAALIDPDAWLYADTDCVVFSRDVSAKLDIHAKRYGAWKIEEEGTRYKIIAKKVYAEVTDDGTTGKTSAKGLNVKRLTPDDFARWLDGEPPEQVQIQSNNFLAVLCGAEMYRTQVRKGTRVETTI